MAKDYKAAEIRTAVSYMYGRFETRMMASDKSGLVTAMFTFNDENFTTPQWNELDVEVLGRYDDRVQFNVITYNHVMHGYTHMLFKDPSKCFLTYAIEWAPSYVAWFIDGVEVYRDSGAHISELTFTQKFMLNHWATNLAAWAGVFDPASLPAYAYYDSASYYSFTPGSGNYGTGNNFTLLWKDDFDSFNTSRWQAATHTFDENVCDFVPQNAVVKDGHLVLAITDAIHLGFDSDIPADCPALTPTPTRTPTSTWTPTGTPTPTMTPDPFYTPQPTPTSTTVPGVDGTVLVSLPYPNPAASGERVRFDLAAHSSSSVTWEVLTTSFRKIYSKTVVVSGVGSVTWDLKDMKGKPVANGVFHVRFMIDGKETAYHKVMVLR
jgi:hypothetical protein